MFISVYILCVREIRYHLVGKELTSIPPMTRIWPALYDFWPWGTVKVAPHECVIRIGQPKT